MFLQIADDELEHYSRPRAAPREVDGAGKMAQKPWISVVRGTAIGETLRELVGAKAAGSPESDADDMEALPGGCRFRIQGGSRPGAALAMGMDDVREKAFFELLAGIEREHYLALKDAQEHFLDPWSWSHQEGTAWP
ncbi:MAG: hypothetical protein MZW92_65735 [Comamonadaceae bacterium]|nr:hypothetical protein [Comamonadaceae bacterium]